MPWWKSAVFYQIYPRSFYDSNNDGIGDLKGITKKLDYLSFLGIDAIWISPFFKSPMKDGGYDISDYYEIDPRFGTMEDFHELLTEAHERNIKVVIDQVYNHTSDQHPWFLESKRDRKNPKADWYIWKDPKEDGSPPNNWISFFSGNEPQSAWEWGEERKQYYLHLFSKEQPDLNWRNPKVKEEIFKIMRFWLDKGVDGFRFDVISSFFKDPEFRDIIKREKKVAPGEITSIKEYHLYPFVGRPETLLLVEEIRKLLDSYQPERVGIGEVSSYGGIFFYLLFTLPGRLHFAFNFDFLHNISFSAKKIYKLVKNQENLFENISWPCYVLGNHDVHRYISRLRNLLKEEEKNIDLPAKELSKLMATLLLTLRGTPFIYYGEEIGMENTYIPYEKIEDPLGKALFPHKDGRDTARTPMQWNDSKYAGFSEVEPWLPVNENKEYVNVEREIKEEDSILNYYRRLIHKRKESLALKLGNLEFIIPGEDDILAYKREYEKDKKIIILNISDKEKVLNIDIEGKVLLGTYKKEGERINKNINLLPFEGIIIDII